MCSRASAMRPAGQHAGRCPLRTTCSLSASATSCWAASDEQPPRLSHRQDCSPRMGQHALPPSAGPLADHQQRSVPVPDHQQRLLPVPQLTAGDVRCRAESGTPERGTRSPWACCGKPKRAGCSPSPPSCWGWGRRATRWWTPCWTCVMLVRGAACQVQGQGGCSPDAGLSLPTAACLLRRSCCGLLWAVAQLQLACLPFPCPPACRLSCALSRGGHRHVRAVPAAHAHPPASEGVCHPRAV